MQIEEINVNNDGNVIKSITMISLNELVKIKNQIKCAQSQINIIDFNFKESIKTQQEKRDKDVKVFEDQINVLNDLYNNMFKEVCNNAKFEEDKFLQAAKIKGDSYKEGRYRIIRHIKTERKLNQAEFKKKYLEEFMKIAEVGLTKADSEIGKNKVNQLCTINDKYTFKFYDPDEHKEE
jgi:hypothetical protein